MAQNTSFTIHQKNAIEDSINHSVNKIINGYNLKNIIDSMYFQIKKLIDAKYTHEKIIELMNKANNDCIKITISNFTKWFSIVNKERNHERDSCILVRQEEIINLLYKDITTSLNKKIKIENIIDRLNLFENENSVSIDNRFTLANFEKIYDSVTVARKDSSNSVKSESIKIDNKSDKTLSNFKADDNKMKANKIKNDGKNDDVDSSVVKIAL